MEVPSYLNAQGLGGIIDDFGIVVVLDIDGVEIGNLGATALPQRPAIHKGLQKEWGGLVIGLTVGGIIMMTAGPTGSPFNPARTFGPCVVDSLLVQTYSG